VCTLSWTLTGTGALNFIHVTVKCLIGVSLNKPHIDEFAVEFVYIYIYIYIYMYRTSCCKSLPALILRILASFVNSKTIHQWPTTQQEGMNCHTTLMATVRTETTRGPIPIQWLERKGLLHGKKVSPVDATVYVATVAHSQCTCHMDRPLQWPHR